MVSILPIRTDVNGMMSAFGAAYRAIDFRAVTVKRGGSWENVHTVIRFTYEEPGAAATRLQQIENSRGGVHTDSFQIWLGALPVSEWDRIREGLSLQNLKIGDFNVTFKAVEVNLSRTVAYIQQNYEMIRPFDSYDWPVAQFCVNSYGTATLQDDFLVRESTKIGYPDPHEAANLLCELNVHANQSQGYELCVSMPAFAQISMPRVLPKEKRVVFDMKRDRELRMLTTAVLFRGREHHKGEPWKRRVSVEPKITEDGNMLGLVGSADLPNLRSDDTVEVQLLHPDLGELCRMSHSVHYLIPAAQRNILLEALKFFCPESKINSLTVRPFDEKPPRMKVAAAFELRISWLLGALGLSTAILGDYENIVASATGMRRGSIDILAASQHSAVLVPVACTTGPPKDEDFRILVASAEILHREVFTDANVRIVPLLCTCAPGQEAYVNGVGVLDADRLALTLRLVNLGRENDVLDFILNPSFQQLREPDSDEW